MLCAESLTALEFEPGDELDPVAEGRVGGAMLSVDDGRGERCKDSIRGEGGGLLLLYVSRGKYRTRPLSNHHPSSAQKVRLGV